MAQILTEIIDRVGVITLNRADALNCFDRNMALTLQAALDNYEAEDTVRCIYLTANGMGFSAGQDIKYLMSPEAVEFSRIVEEHYNPIIQAINEMSKVVVCGVNGVAAGAGANIALACDITVATESAKFIQAFSKIGLIPDSGGTYFLPRLIGLQRAKAITMLGDLIRAEEAAQMGMIYKCFPDNEFKEKAFAIATKLSQMPLQALKDTKKLMNASLNNNLIQQLHLEAKTQTKLSETDDYKEGINAFIEKRKPKYQG